MSADDKLAADLSRRVRENLFLKPGEVFTPDEEDEVGKFIFAVVQAVVIYLRREGRLV